MKLVVKIISNFEFVVNIVCNYEFVVNIVYNYEFIVNIICNFYFTGSYQLSFDFYRLLDQFLGPQLTSLASDIGDQYSKKLAT